MSNPQEEQSGFVTCRCQHCHGHIEFNSGGLLEGEEYSVECPHCHLETKVEMQPVTKEPPIIPPPTPLDPISLNGLTPTLEIGLSSGLSFSVLAVRLYDEKSIEELKTKSADALQWLEEAAHAESLEAKKELRKLSSRGTAIQSRVRPWDVYPTGAAAVIGILEPFTANKSYKSGMGLLKEVKEAERELVNTGLFFHISRIENISQAVPEYWRAGFNSKTYVHDGLDFVTVLDAKRNTPILRWDAVEYFNYSDAKGVPLNAE